jgi:osmotically inducible protein OsmC
MTPSEKAHAAEPAGKVIYTAKTRATGGREKGTARSSDGRLDITLSLPGSQRIGTNPEQLFAAGWSICFESAIRQAARRRQVAVAEIIIDTEVDLHLAGDDEYSLGARFNISIPGINRTIAEQLIEDAEQLCPYSRATRGNIEVVFNLI